METIFQTLIASFDFTFCLIVNVLTYILVNAISDIKGKTLTTWNKRIILMGCLVLVSVVYYSLGIDTKLLFNSAILAPVSWSWIFKPLCKHFNLDYND